jgi:hypothetical protein
VRLSVDETRVSAVHADPEEFRIHQRLEHGSADGLFEAAEPLDLRGGQAQAGHLEVLGAYPFNRAEHGQ